MATKQNYIDERAEPFAIPDPPMQQLQTFTIPRNRSRYRWKLLIILAVSELFIAVALTVIGAMCFALLWESVHGPRGCIIGIGTWVGLICIITAAIGVGAVFTETNRCLMSSYFVLLIIVTVFSVITAANSGFWAAQITRWDAGGIDYTYDLTLHIILAVLATIHFLVCLLAAIWFCRFGQAMLNGCCGSPTQDDPLTLAYTTPVTPN